MKQRITGQGLLRRTLHHVANVLGRQDFCTIVRLCCLPKGQRPCWRGRLTHDASQQMQQQAMCASRGMVKLTCNEAAEIPRADRRRNKWSRFVTPSSPATNVSKGTRTSRDLGNGMPHRDQAAAKPPTARTASGSSSVMASAGFIDWASAATTGPMHFKIESVRRLACPGCRCEPDGGSTQDCICAATTAEWVFVGAVCCSVRLHSVGASCSEAGAADRSVVVCDGAECCGEADAADWSADPQIVGGCCEGSTAAARSAGTEAG